MANPLNRVSYPDIASIRVYVNPSQERRARALITKFPQILRTGYKNGSYNFCMKVLKLIKRAMQTHMPPKGSGVSWPALSASTLKRWGDHGIYVLTGQYLNSIRLQVSDNGYKVFVGLPRQVVKRSPKNRNNHLTLTQVAQILEFGTASGKIPPRPLWRPSFKAAGGGTQLRKDIVKEIQKEVRRHI